MKKTVSFLIAALCILCGTADAAFKIPNAASSTFSNANHWDSVTNTPTLHASTNVTISTSNYYTATYTAPNTTNACTGVLMYISGTGTTSTGTVTVTLQENSVDTACAVTVNGTTFVAGSWYYFRFSTPYVFTSTTAGYYRFRVSRTGTWTSSSTIAADSGGSTIAFLATDNRTGAPTNESIIVAGQNGTTTPVTLTVDGSQSCGNGGSEQNPITAERSILAGVIVSNGGTITWDTAASATLSCLGHFVVGRGYWYMGNSTTCYPTGKVATLSLNQNGTSVNYGVNILATIGGVELYGEPKTTTSLWKTHYASGVGTAADPLIVADGVDWSVNDEIIVCASSDNATNYNESENKYIKTKNSATSYVISDTAGGAEAALTYTHNTNAWILNLTRNVVITTNSSSQGNFLHNYCTTNNAVKMQWIRWNYPAYGATTTTKYAFNLYNYTSSSAIATFDYSVLYGSVASYSAYWTTTKAPATHTGIICCNGAGGASGIGISSCYNKTLVNYFAVKMPGSGLITPTLTTLNYSYIISCAGMNGASFATFNNCEFHCNRQGAVSTYTNYNVNTFNNCLFGTKGKNAADVNCYADAYGLMLFNNCTFGSDTLVNGYTGAGDGTLIRFHNFGTTAMKHIWYTNYGICQATGSGLTDTNVRTPGSYAVRLAPENATTGLMWQFHIPAKSGKITAFSGFFKKNAAFATDVAKVELWNPGSTSADATFTLADLTTWQACSISAYYSGSVDGLATIKVYAMSATAGAYLYCDDFYNSGDTVTSTDKVTGLDTWFEALPIDIIAPSAVSAADIWTFSTTALTTAGTTGKTLVDAEHKADDACVLRGVN